MGSILAQDEKSWRQNYADIPNTSVIVSAAKMGGKNSDPNDLSDFSQFHLEGASNFSMGQFFDNRNEKLYDMLPFKSPTKRRKPHPLYDDSSTEPENCTYETSPPVRDSTVRQQDSILSISAIAAHMCKSSFCAVYNKGNARNFTPITVNVTDDSPTTVTNKLLDKKNRNKSSTVCAPVTAQPEILYITKPIPLTATGNENSNVKVLKVEEYYGRPLTIHGGRLKPTNIISADNIRRNQQAKLAQMPEMAEAMSLPDDDKENCFAAQSETMSVTDSVLEACANDCSVSPTITSIDAAVSPLNNFTGTASEHLPHRRAQESPAKSLGQQFSSMTIDENRQPYSRSPATTKSLEQKLAATTASPSRSYRGAASPTISSGMPSPNMQHISTSTERDTYQRASPSKKQYLQIDQRARARSRSVSPSLLSQYQSSQCVSSTSSLNSNSDHFCIKSSHGELSWAGTKLRRIVKKTFTIKNVAHRKTSLKLGIVGPGFQVSVFGLVKFEISILERFWKSQLIWSVVLRVVLCGTRLSIKCSRHLSSIFDLAVNV